MNIKFQTKVITTEYPKKKIRQDKNHSFRSKRSINNRLTEFKKLLSNLILKIE